MELKGSAPLATVVPPQPPQIYTDHPKVYCGVRDPSLNSDCKHLPFLANSSVNMFLFLGSIFTLMQQLDYNNGNRAFLCGQ
jgi:hypothetical protein